MTTTMMLQRVIPLEYVENSKGKHGLTYLAVKNAVRHQHRIISNPSIVDVFNKFGDRGNVFTAFKWRQPVVVKTQFLPGTTQAGQLVRSLRELAVEGDYLQAYQLVRFNSVDLYIRPQALVQDKRQKSYTAVQMFGG